MKARDRLEGGRGGKGRVGKEEGEEEGKGREGGGGGKERGRRHKLLSLIVLSNGNNSELV